MPSPPPLPTSLSSRLQSSIDPLTGTCRHHPQVKLCELVQNNTRWVVRRKICYKCGNRGNGKHHRPGVAVKSSGSERRLGEDSGRRMRSTSVGSSGHRVGSTAGGNDGGRAASLTRGARSMSRERGQPKRGSTSDGRDKGAAPVAATAPSSALVSIPSPTPVAAPTPVNVQDEDEEEDFDESDPIIYIPTLSPDEELPPPPPRTEEEAEIHGGRLEMRRSHDEKADKKKNKSHVSKVVVAKPDDIKEIDADEIMPSEVALALLGAHGKSDNNYDEKKKTQQHVEQPSRGHRTRDCKKNTEKKSSPAHENKKHNEFETHSETSSISTASAKLRKLEPDNELYAKHGELKGVVFNRDPVAYPPREIGCHNRSLSRGRRQKKIVDPEEEQRKQLVVFDPPEVQEKKDEDREKKSSSKVYPVAENEKRSSASHHRRKTHEGERETKHHVRHVTPPIIVEDTPVKANKSTRDHRSSSRHRHRVVEAVPHSEVKYLAASAARMSRQKNGVGAGSKSLGHRHQSRERVGRSTCRSTAASGTPRRSVSRSKRQSILDEAADCCSILADRSTKGGGASKVDTARRSSGNRTACTQPLSVSSDEIYGKRENNNNKAKTQQEEETPEVLYKKRARRHTTSSRGPDMPLAHIALSSDEKSHASSISSSSSSSTIEESFAYSDHDDAEAKGDKSRKSGCQSQGVKASSVLKDVKGGAVGLASRGRSALGGLKHTSKKWQSAMFM